MQLLKKRVVNKLSQEFYILVDLKGYKQEFKYIIIIMYVGTSHTFIRAISQQLLAIAGRLFAYVLSV